MTINEKLSKVKMQKLSSTRLATQQNMSKTGGFQVAPYSDTPMYDILTFYD
jgi:hypothetical protein